jgi:ribosomal-protein-alanine acetyltransferase
MTVKIRTLRGGDLWQVLTIERRAFPEDPWTTATAGGWLVRATRGGRASYTGRLARFIRFTRVNETIGLVRLARLAVLKRPASLCCLVAEADGAIAGYACLDAVTGGAADLQMIAVRADRRGGGIGTALLSRLIATAAARGCGEVFLYVRASNHRARLLYRRTGFTDAGVKPGYYQPSGTDAIVMRLYIPARSRPAAGQGARRG